jgi:hypothetical protein
MNYGVLGLVTGEIDGAGKNSFAKKLLSANRWVLLKKTDI